MGYPTMEDLKKDQSPKSQEPRLTLHPSWNLEFGPWNLRLCGCGNLSHLQYNNYC